MEYMNHLIGAAERFELCQMTEEIIRLTDPAAVCYDSDSDVHTDVVQRVSPVMQSIRSMAESILHLIK